MSGDPVHHPRHYTAHPSGVECIDIVEHLPFNAGSLVKYLWRTGLKDSPTQERAKAVWYAHREAGRLRWSQTRAREQLAENIGRVLAVEPVGTPLHSALLVLSRLLAGAVDDPDVFEELAGRLREGA